VRFETPPGEQAQVDLARFEVEFTDESGATRIVWLFSMVLGFLHGFCAATLPRSRRLAAYRARFSATA
jgi:hypothetical protein